MFFDVLFVYEDLFKMVVGNVNFVMVGYVYDYGYYCYYGIVYFGIDIDMFCGNVICFVIKG